MKCTVLLDTYPTARHMLGCYATADDDTFLDVITDELDQFQSSADTSSILLFPCLSPRHRLLLHRLRDANYSNLFSFSVGEQRTTRRTVICFKSQLMDETNIEKGPAASSSVSVSERATTTVLSTGDASTKRRPTQALYQPPGRGKNQDAPSPTPVAPVSASVENVQPQDEIATVVKSKATRPSVEPYVPPSRRSLPVNKEPVIASPKPPVVKDGSGKGDDLKRENKEEDNDDAEDWEKAFDDNENPPSDELVEEIGRKFKAHVQIRSPTNDYSQWTVDDMQVKEADLAHIIEVSNFPSTLRTEDLSSAFKSLTRTGFDIKWVDETHALIVFPDATMALDALQMEHPMFKVCSMSQASSASKKKVKNSLEFIQPYKARPQTSSLTANRRICAALGVKSVMSTDKTKTERQKIESARQQKIRDKEEQKTVWDGGVLPTASTT